MRNSMQLSEALADAEVFTDGDWVETKDQDPNGGVRLTQLADVGDGNWINKSARYLSFEKSEKLKCTFLKPGDLLIARMPDPLGRCCVFPGDRVPCVTVVDVCIIRPNKKRIDNIYLMHMINSPLCRRGIDKHVTGTTRQRISRKNLGKIEIFLPPLAEQKRIAAILDAADALRTKRRQSLDQLDTLLQSTFLDMFGDPVTNPRGWDTVSGADAFQELTYGTSNKSTDKFTAKSLPVLRIPNIIGGQIDWCNLKYAEPTNSEVAKLILRLDDLLLVRTNGNPDYIGRCARYNDDRKSIFASYLIRGRLSPTVGLEAEYLKHLIEFPTYRHKVRREARTTAGNFNLSTTGIRKFKFTTPPIGLQRRFATIVESVEQQKTRLRSHLAELDTLFASLQSRAFNGEL